MLFSFLKRQRRRKALRGPFPTSWREILRQNASYYRHLPGEDRQELERHIRIFLAEKSFEGCGGLAITDEIRVTIAAYACILLLHRKHDYYPGLESILVYPRSFWVKTEQIGPAGVIFELDEEHAGEAWSHGSVVLSWDHICHTAREPGRGLNVVLHEFAHVLDWQDGSFNGTPPLERASGYISWARILGEEYRALVEAKQCNQESLINYYGAANPAEFFAVITECFFEKAIELRARHPKLYQELQRFYCQDPAARMETSGLSPSSDTVKGK